MHPLLYISLPVILSCGLLAILFPVYRRLSEKSWQVVFSFVSAVAHVILACGAALLTALDPISSIACSSGVTGLFASIAFALMDSGNLLISLIIASRHGRNRGVGISISFLLLRLSLHAALILSFWWFAALCTV